MTREDIYFFLIFHLCHLMICKIFCVNQALFYSHHSLDVDSDEEASYSDFYPIIPADLMSVKEILKMDNLPRHRTW